MRAHSTHVMRSPRGRALGAAVRFEKGCCVARRNGKGPEVPRGIEEDAEARAFAQRVCVGPTARICEGESAGAGFPGVGRGRSGVRSGYDYWE